MFRQLKAEIDSFFDRDPAAKSRLEIILCYPGFHALVMHRLAHAMWNGRFRLRLLARWLSQFARFMTGIEIHPGATIGKRLFIDHGIGVVIGETATIGDYVTIYHGVTLGGTSSQPGIRHPQIGNGVVIGAGAQLLGPVNVGNGARIGSNAVVVKDVPEGASMVGVPARQVSLRKKNAEGVEEKIAFQAYGDINHTAEKDPRQLAIDKLMKEVKALKKEVSQLREDEDKQLEDSAKKWEVHKS